MVVFYIVVVGWIFSVCLHEYAHARVAHQGGDYTVEEKGYLSFNPLKYADPIWSFVMPLVFLALGGIGLPGGAVYINHHLLRSKLWETATSLAGPATNLLLAIVLGALFHFGLLKPDSTDTFSCAVAFLIELQVMALLLNLLPLPPLDGFQALAPWLPSHWRETAMNYSNIVMMILFLALWNLRPVSIAFAVAVHTLSSLLGSNPALADVGWYEFQFWRH